MAKPKKSVFKKWWFWVLAIIVVIAVASPGEEDAVTETKAEEAGNKQTEKEKQPEGTEKEEVEEEEEEEVVKDPIVFEFEQAEYLADSEEFKIVAKTSLPDSTEVYFGLKGEEDYDYNGVPQSAVVEGGVLELSLGTFVDEYDGREYLKNGTYQLAASLTVNKDLNNNTHLLEKYGEFKAFTEKYEIDGTVEETEQGYVIENIAQKEINLENAYSSDEIQQFKLEAKKADAETIDFKQLDKNADRHAGKYVTYTGEIIQIMEGDNYTQIRLALDDWGNEVLFVEYDGYTDFVEGDKVTIYGEVYGSYSYQSQAGWEITLPGILADIVE
ncbi:hypothetical protein [Thalassobacillus hwangdonensis]|uniref:Uncharacterized protein n=1 Tax=Thalassobacillus hwangdonensis TaxID=546108 RepID=A0ABW3L461_9BACI